MKTRQGALVALTAAAAVAVPATGATAAPVATAVGLPAAGSWAIGYSAVVRGGGQASTTGSLQLVGPSGGVVKTLATGLPVYGTSVEDAQYDLSRVVTSTWKEGSSTGTFTVWNVRTGAKTSFTLTGTQVSVHLTATGLLSSVTNAGKTVTAARDHSGRVTRTFPALSGQGDTEVSPGGTLVMQETSTGVALRRASDGSVVRTIAKPSGTVGCSPLGLWGQGYVKMVCGGTTPGKVRVYAVSTTKGSPIAVTPMADYWDAWPTSGQRSVLKVHGDMTGVGYLDGGQLAPYLGGSYSEIGLGAHGSSLWIGETTDGWIKRTDVRSGAVTGVAGPGTPTGGFVFDARLVDTVN